MTNILEEPATKIDPFHKKSVSSRELCRQKIDCIIEKKTTFKPDTRIIMNRTGAAAAAVVVCCGLNSCVRQPDDRAINPQNRPHGNVARPAGNALLTSFSDMPSWLDIYREKNVVGVSTVDHVVIVTFETLGGRDEVYRYYSGKFGSEENFASFRDNHDIISIVREGFGVKITLLDQSKNLWSLEYHKQTI